MGSNRILLIGAGGHAKACIDAIESEGRFTIAGLIGAADQVGMEVLGYKVLATDSKLATFIPRIDQAFIAVGQIHTSELREQLSQKLLASGFTSPSIISASAHVSSHATIGPGTVVMAGAVVNAGASVGTNCIINTNSIVEHDTVVGDFVHLSTGAILNGAATVGDRVFIGSGSVVKEGLNIGSNCIIGMGSVLRTHLEAGSTYKGVTDR